MMNKMKIVNENYPSLKEIFLDLTSFKELKTWSSDLDHHHRHVIMLRRISYKAIDV